MFMINVYTSFSWLLHGGRTYILLSFCHFCNARNHTLTWGWGRFPWNRRKLWSRSWTWLWIWNR